MKKLIHLMLIACIFHTIHIHAQILNNGSTVEPSIYHTDNPTTYPNSSYPTSSPSPTIYPNNTNPTWYPTIYPNNTNPTWYPTTNPNDTNPTWYPTGNPNGTNPTWYPTTNSNGTNPTWYPTTNPNSTNPTWYPTTNPNGTNPTWYPTRTPNGTNPTWYPTTNPNPNGTWPNTTYPTRDPNPRPTSSPSPPSNSSTSSNLTFCTGPKYWNLCLYVTCGDPTLMCVVVANNITINNTIVSVCQQQCLPISVIYPNTTIPNNTSYPNTSYPTSYPNTTLPTELTCSPYVCSNITCAPQHECIIYQKPIRINSIWVNACYPTCTFSNTTIINGTNQTTTRPTSSPNIPKTIPTIRIRSIAFTIYWSSSRLSYDTIYKNEIAHAIQYIATLANIPQYQLILNATDITRTYGIINARTGLWKVKLGFQEIYVDTTSQYIESFLARLFQLPSVPQDLNTSVNGTLDDSPLSGLAIDHTQVIIETSDESNTKICANGNIINVNDECTTSSIPIVIIALPIVAVIVFVSIITYVLIRRHRRAASIKAMTYATDTTMGENTTPYVKETYENDTPIQRV